MDEFGLIRRHLAPLAGAGGRGLRDDVASLGDGVVTKDLIVCGTHFRADDPLDSVGWKAVAVNASDIIAKGCKPEAVLLGVAWPRAVGEEDIAAFSAGLGEALGAYGATLLGGDTTRHAGRGPLTISVTMTGGPLGAAPVWRSGAMPGDLLFAGGTIGDAHLGLLQLEGRHDAGSGASSVVRAYRRPHPPPALAGLVARHASASLDVSDGLLADARHLAEESGLRCRIEGVRLPLSSAGEAFAAGGEGARAALAAGGDDYVPLFAVPQAQAEAMRKDAATLGLAIFEIGACEEGSGIRYTGLDGTERSVARGGYRHFGD
ncbi:thiamine-phosphate kinase [Parvularcula oceani]|uniref:thiamine-phosphate kinase n=1 Tax=Parvularcula oceani TaxID=1247963 RepID=UPI0004E249D0|nr:thiamine-phosphate kinase [Parvularcula oceani]